MNFVELQENLENLSQSFQKETFLFGLLSVYELPKSTISLLSKNPSKLSGREDQIILKNKVLFRVTALGEDEHLAIDALQKDKNSYKFNPRFIIVTDFVTILAVDTKTKETLDIQIRDLGKHYAFFLPWAGMEKSQTVNENPADIRAAYKMDKLYQAIVNDNPEYYQSHSHDLNIFLSRLLFCFFAEDTGIFSQTGLFTNSIISHTHENGDGLDTHFSTLFKVMNKKDGDRSEFASHFLEFPYVNGGLFEDNIKLPAFTGSSRKLIIECGKLNWDSINPDIFGSMIQAVVHPGQRESLGMHYTSVPNIMKVIEPLFLNDLYEELENSKNDVKKLTKLRERISKIRVFDPACGSGNFLIISYKELSKLESKIISYTKELNHDVVPYSGVSLNSFYGIEIDDFAHEIARLSLWLAQHQMNQYFDGIFGIMKATLPLKESGKIVCSNSTRIDWNEVCPRKDQFGNEYEIYVAGNPPFEGSRKQQESHKSDIEFVFKSEVRIYKSLDYVCIWYLKLAQYLSGFNLIRGAFVSTNSITQGEHVSLLWPIILTQKVEIFFGYRSFKWKNLAKGNAGVTCVIIGLSNPGLKNKRIYDEGKYQNVVKINPYLTEGETVFIHSRSTPISNFPEINFGNMAADGGKLILSSEERDALMTVEPESSKWIRKLVTSDTFLNGGNRYCLWMKNITEHDLTQLPNIRKIINSVRKIRQESSRPKLAQIPHLFAQITQKDNIDYIFVPRVSSERRVYIPIGIANKNSIITDSCYIVPANDLHLFSIITSRMHMVWVRAVGGKMKTDLSYSKNIVYNNFPFPEITSQQKKSLISHVYNILEEREKYPEKTMATLYDPDKMPNGLREAHKYLDLAIDQLYRSKPFESDEDRLAHLFKLYEEMITRKANG
ncbi:MAG: DNA methyltransferase [Candidatus Paceibacterota bacterium]|jgi:hypothetical protein